MAEIEIRDANGVVRTITTNEDPPTGAKLDALLAALLDIAPVSDHVAVTPSDATVLTGVRGLKIGTGGTIAVRVNGVDRTYTASDGEYLPLKAQRVLATGTTATDITAWK
tara:strand:- start:10625 stop:10954 length:330 start_codon:yes stop_codon:yes gene_type:complete